MESTDTRQRELEVVEVESSSRADDWLSKAAYDETISTYSSQRGEDRILQKLFEVIGTANQWCVEFGATDGKHMSNTWYWITQRNWHSVQIEASRDRNLGLRDRNRWSFEALQARYADNDRVTCLNEWIDTTGDKRLDALLDKTELPREFDLLSIDIDSTEYAIWDSLVDYSPRVVVVEHTKTIPLNVSFHSNRGSSLRALTELGTLKGYELVAVNDLNGVFVRKDLFGQLGISDNSPEKLWSGHEQYLTYLEQNDGSLVLHGPNKLRWVRGVDGTITGELKSGHWTPVGAGASTVTVDASAKQKTYLSGLIRHVWWTLKK